MRITSLARRLAVPAVATAALVAAIGAPASAELEGTQGIVVTGTGATTGVFLNGLQISASCVIEASGAVAATVLTQCRLVGNPIGQNHSIALPGPVAATSFVERVTTLDFQLCWDGYAIPISNPEDQLPIHGCANGVGDVDVVTSGVTFETY